MGKLKIKNGFSDRNGLVQIGKELQIDSLDDITRIDIINAINEYLGDSQESFGDSPDVWAGKIGVPIANAIGKIVFHQIIPINGCLSFNKVMASIQHVVLEHEYDDVLSIVEVFAETTDSLAEDPEYYLPNPPPQNLFLRLNCVFENDNVGYRFVDEKITKITDKEQIKNIEKAIAVGSNSSVHFEKALSLISERGQKDYENSIKESITAVEAECEIIVGKRATLGEALAKLEKAGTAIHPCLKEAFNKLYGYTSDAKGIRHAGNLDSKGATFEEAEYMLVSCSAFVSYLVSISK